MKRASKIYHDFMRFADRNPEYLFCSLAYYLLACFLFGFGLFNPWMVRIVLALIYVMSIGIAFSSLGETILRLFSHVRRPETAREKELLYPIFDDVIRNAKEKNPEFEDCHIDVYIKDEVTVNAFAIGKHTVVVTKGALQTFSEDELRAVLAHEVAHIIHADTTARIYTLIGNGIFSFFVLIIKLIGWLFLQVFSRRFSLGASKLTRGSILDVLVFALTFLMQVALSFRDRKAERRADSYTVQLGYGEDMVSALYLLEKISLSGEGTLIQKLLASHPRTTSRIEELELELGIQQAEVSEDVVNYNELSLGQIFDMLEGMKYGESWDILQSCSDEVVRDVAKSCRNPDAKSAAKAILNKNRGKVKSEQKPETKPANAAPLVICTVILIALAVFFGPSLIYSINNMGATAPVINETTGNNNSGSSLPREVFGSTGNSGTGNQQATATPAPTPSHAISYVPRWNGIVSDATFHDILGIFGSGDANPYTAFFDSNPFSDAELSNAPEALVNHIKSGELFQIRLANTNFRNKAEAMEKWYANYDRHQVLGEFGDPPLLMESLWGADLEGNLLPTTDYENADRAMLTVMLVISPDDEYAVAFDTYGNFTVVQLVVVTRD